MWREPIFYKKAVKSINENERKIQENIGIGYPSARKFLAFCRTDWGVVSELRPSLAFPKLPLPVLTETSTPACCFPPCGRSQALPFEKGDQNMEYGLVKMLYFAFFLTRLLVHLI